MPPPKRTLKPFDSRLPTGEARLKKRKLVEEERAKPRQVEQVPTALFFSNNEQLGPPYYVLVDTNFLNQCIKNKIELVDGMMNCLYAKCIPVILDSVMAELEKLGTKYRVALRMAKDERILRMPGYVRLLRMFFGEEEELTPNNNNSWKGARTRMTTL
jgi:U3 small nucleolar RNA-associated protein 24